MSAQKQPIIFSFFSGSGFLDLGFEMSGFDVRFVNEFHSSFLEAYKYSREQMNLPEPKYGHHLGSIDDFVTGTRKNELFNYVQEAKQDGMVGFIGGPPCPDFSAAGKHRGSDGDNGKLTKVYIESIIANQPDFFLFENVKGLWRTAKHREFYEEMKQLLEEANYVITDRVINSIEYGVPQDRDRILLFGIHRDNVDELSREQLEVDFQWEAEIVFDREVVLNKDLWPKTDKYKEAISSRRKIPKHLENYQELTVQHWFEKNQVNYHPNAKHHFKPYSQRFKTVLEGDDGKKSFKRLHRFRYSPTAAYGNNEVHLHPYKSRRMSAAEALAIQSLPKEFHFPSTMTLTDMFKTICNGVPYLASEGLAKTIHTYLKSL